MQLPEILTKQSAVIEILNIFGLGLLGVGIVVLYRALISRSNLLSEGLNEIKKAYQSVLDMMDRRAALIDKRFEDEKSFRTLYLSFFEDSDVHLKRIKEWKEDEVTHLQVEVTRLSEQLRRVETDLKKLMDENLVLKDKLTKIEEAHRSLLLENQELSPSPPPNVRGLH